MDDCITMVVKESHETLHKIRPASPCGPLNEEQGNKSLASGILPHARGDVLEVDIGFYGGGI
jgi:hypothetical protein